MKWPAFILTFFLLNHVSLAQEGGGAAYSGITEPAADATLSFPVSGVLARCAFREGAFVRAGEVICELRHEAQRLEVERRRLILTNARTDLDRTQRLFDKTGSVSEEELDEKRATVHVAEAELAIAEEQLKQRRLVAPFDGLIADHHGLEEGEGAEILQPIVRLVDTQRGVFVCNLPAAEATQLREDSNAVITVGEIQCPGTVIFVSPVIDPSSGLLKVKVAFDNAGGQVIPGAAGQVRFSK